MKKLLMFLVLIVICSVSSVAVIEECGSSSEFILKEEPCTSDDEYALTTLVQAYCDINHPECPIYETSWDPGGPPIYMCMASITCSKEVNPILITKSVPLVEAVIGESDHAVFVVTNTGTLDYLVDYKFDYGGDEFTFEPDGEYILAGQTKTVDVTFTPIRAGESINHFTAVTGEGGYMNPGYKVAEGIFIVSLGLLPPITSTQNPFTTTTTSAGEVPEFSASGIMIAVLAILALYFFVIKKKK